jgi:hypothetical protein
MFINDIPSKIYFNINSFIGEYMEIKLSHEEMSNNFIMKQYYEERKNDLLKQIETHKDYNNLLQEQIITIINNHCIKNGISISNIVFSEEQDGYEQEDMENDENNDIRVMKVSIEFKCSYENLIKFIDDLKNDRVDIAITNMRIIKWDDSTISAATDLNFYSFSMNE